MTLVSLDFTNDVSTFPKRLSTALQAWLSSQNLDEYGIESNLIHIGRRHDAPYFLQTAFLAIEKPQTRLC